jgi:ribulose-bisphosphate carboxylase small chain
MSEIRDYPSRMGDPASRRHETFSYLPEMDPPRVRAQVEFLLGKGWTAGVEHVEPDRSAQTYWYMWKLPLFGEDDPDRVLAELDACRAAHPGHHVRLIGYDTHRQTLGSAMVVHRGR